MQGPFNNKNNFSLFLSKKDGQVQEGELIDDEIVRILKKRKENFYEINIIILPSHKI